MEQTLHRSKAGDQTPRPDSSVHGSASRARQSGWRCAVMASMFGCLLLLPQQVSRAANGDPPNLGDLLSSVQSSLAALQNSVSSQQAAIASLANQLASLQNTVTSQQTLISSQSSQISGLQNTVSSQSSQISTLLQNGGGDAANQISTLQSQISTLETNLTNEAAALQKTATDLQNQIKPLTAKLGPLSLTIDQTSGAPILHIDAGTIFGQDVMFGGAIGLPGGVEGNLRINGNLLVDGSITHSIVTSPTGGVTLGTSK